MILWHNPACSKSRAVLDGLREHGIEPALRRYLESPPAPEEVIELARAVGVPLRSLLRSGEEAFHQAGLDGSDPSDMDLAKAVAEHPILLERPILVDDNDGVVGRPPDRAVGWALARRSH